MPLEEREMSSVRVPQGGLRSFDVKEKGFEQPLWLGEGGPF
jgi:hypothetical protein